MSRFKLRAGKINHIFISHLHGDHIFGLFGLISSFSLMGRVSDLNIYAEKRLDDILKSHLAYFGENLSFKVNLIPISASQSKLIYEDEKLTVTTIPLKHRVPCCGFLFREKMKPSNIRKEILKSYQIPIKDMKRIKDGEDFITHEGKVIPNHKLTIPAFKPRSYAYITDTRMLEKNIPLLKDVDLLYHEATFLEKDKNLAQQTYHSTAMQAANIALKCNAGKLLIGHFSVRYKSSQYFADEAHTIFKETYAVEDGDCFSVEQERLKREDD